MPNEKQAASLSLKNSDAFRRLRPIVQPDALALMTKTNIGIDP